MELTEKEKKQMTTIALREGLVNKTVANYFIDIIDNMTLEDAKNILEIGVEYGLVNDNNKIADAIKVIRSYIGSFSKIYNMLSYKKDASDFNDYYTYVCNQLEHYTQKMEQLKDESSIEVMFAKIMFDDIVKKYSKLANYGLLREITAYYKDNIINILISHLALLQNKTALKKASIMNGRKSMNINKTEMKELEGKKRKRIFENIG